MAYWATSILFIGLLAIIIQYDSNFAYGQESMSVWVDSHQNNQKVPVTGFTMEGGSSDTDDSDCEVLVRLNEIEPYNQTVALGPSGDNDFSRWQFNFPSLSEGINSVTAKYVCWDDPLLDSYYTLYVEATTSDLSYMENSVSMDDGFDESFQYYSEDEPTGMVTTHEPSQATSQACGETTPTSIGCSNTEEKEALEEEEEKEEEENALAAQRFAEEAVEEEEEKKEEENAVAARQLADDPEGDDQDEDDEETEENDE